MESHSEILTGDRGDFIEQNCCIKLNGKEFCSGGSWLMVNKKTGLREGILYLTKEDGGFKVGTWDGSKKVKAHRITCWKGNFGDDRSSFVFRWEGKAFWGINAGDNDIVRCREYKNQ